MRLTRFRWLARLTCRLATTIPSREFGSAVVTLSNVPIRLEALLSQASNTLAYDAESRRREDLGKACIPGTECSAGRYADRRTRPRARRRARTLRPFFVAMRALNPWFLFRFNTLGWNVRFMPRP